MSEQNVMLQLPTKWDVTKEEDEKMANILGKEGENAKVYEDGFIFVNPKRIDAINKSSIPNTSVLRFSGDVFNIDMPLKALMKLLKSNGVEFKTIDNIVL